MKVLFETSLLVAALVQSLPQHGRAAKELRRSYAGEFDFCVAAHALAELFAVLTTLPLSPRLMAGEARSLIRRNVLSKAEIVALTGADYEAVIERMLENGLVGGVIYDALHVMAAEKAGAGRLVTLNRRDFERIPSQSLEFVFL